MYHLRRVTIAALLIIITWVGLSALHKHLDPNTHKSEEEYEDADWIQTSQYWIDRQACRWMGLCGLAHWRPDPAIRPWSKKRLGKDLSTEEDIHAKYLWEEVPGDGERVRPGDWDGDPRVLKEVPQFVLDHAPLIHLYSGEQFWPSDIREHLMHTSPYANHTAMNVSDFRVTPDNLHQLDDIMKGKYVFMNSKQDVEDRPEWLGSAYNKPLPYGDEDEEDEDDEDELYVESFKEPTEEDQETWFDPYGSKHKNKIVEPLPTSFRTQRPSRTELRKRIGPVMPKRGGYSPAPAILVLVDKGSGILDAFWFYFYSYNLGTTVLNIRFGNHVGDWEHSLIRFYNGVPKAVFFSAHSGGIAYSYDAVEKGKGEGREGRPVLYSALGSHAMYATPGKHPYVLPFNMLADVTDRGPLWDPALNYLGYYFNTSITHNADAHSLAVRSDRNHFYNPREPLTAAQKSEALQPVASNPKAPLSWWWFNGHWGDKFYELGDLRQWRFVGQYHYVNGPLGPRFKNLGRSRVCQSGGTCRIVDSLTEGGSWIQRRRV